MIIGTKLHAMAVSKNWGLGVSIGLGTLLHEVHQTSTSDSIRI